MILRELPLTELRPASYNPRRTLVPGDPGYERLARSLTEFSLVQPIVWNEQTGCIVSGHQRVAILKHRGAETAPVVVVSLPLEREKALNVALNNREVGGDWDNDKLVTLLTELEALPDFDETLTGFDERTLHDLLFQPVEQPFQAPDETEPDAITVTLRINPDDWDEVHDRLDTLLAEWDIGIQTAMGGWGRR